MNEGCRSLAGIIVATTIKAMEGTSSRRRKYGCKNSFKGLSAQGQCKFGKGSKAGSVGAGLCEFTKCCWAPNRLNKPEPQVATAAPVLYREAKPPLPVTVREVS